MSILSMYPGLMAALFKGKIFPSTVVNRDYSPGVINLLKAEAAIAGKASARPSPN